MSSLLKIMYTKGMQIIMNIRLWSAATEANCEAAVLDLLLQHRTIVLIGK